MHRFACLFAGVSALFAQNLTMSATAYEDRVLAAWYGQIAGALMGFEFEHKAAAVAPVERIPARFQTIPVDDDWYYEMVAVRGFEEYGVEMTAEQLGEQWKRNNAGSWGSSEQARLLLARGIKAPDTGHPRYNRLWFTIGPQFSADVYGMTAPAMPNLAAAIARRYGHVNGYAEGVDGAVFVAGMISLAFSENDSRRIVRGAARLIHPSSPYRQCLDLVIAMAERGAPPEEVANALEDRWRVEYPATNNAVANGGLVALSVWFGGGDFLRTVNLAFAASDFSDADCNAANAGAVVGAMRGMKGIPSGLVKRLGDRIQGGTMGGVELTPPVDESVTDLARRTARIGRQFIVAHGGKATADSLELKVQSPETQPAELFQLGDLMQWWNPEWRLLRAGVGGAGGGMRGLRGNTYLDGDVLATYPRDEVRGVVLTREAALGPKPRLIVEVGADGGRAWALDVHRDNDQALSTIVEAKGPGREWRTVEVDLSAAAGKRVTLRLIQRVLLGPERAPGNAYWRNLRLE
ncbi:MAG: ADP-ribosylglycohydrolase family protein [Bryobacteraceae bacterium]|nr:ADP-ribosylglycohydrolase family protein [Bryobacteraceae bacterium]